jgi:hypothetical protein
MALRSPVNDLSILHYAEPVVLETTTDKETIMGFGEPVEFLAMVSAPSGMVVAAQYGPKLPYVRVLSTGSMRLKEGWGVWIDAPTTGKPDYKVIADRSTPRQYTCDIGKRAAFGG